LLAGLTIGLAGARLFPHPVYTGSCISCAGVSIAVGSASGLWLVSPIVALSCTALVLGQGRHNQRTPARVLPQAGTSPPTGMDRLRFYLFVLLPWLALYEVVLAIGIPPDAISGVSRFEQRLPVLEWTQIVYASTYFLTIFAPVFAKTRSDLRRYSMRALWTMLVAYPAFLLIPLIAPKRPFTPQTIPGHLLLWERTLDSPVAAFPSFHVIWAMLAAEVFARRWPRLKGLFYGWAILVAVSCVTTSQHSILDVLGGAATVALVARAPRIGTAARRAIGPAQVMSRGFYAGVAAFLGLWLAETMAGASAQTNTLVAGTWLIVAALSAGAPLARAVDSLRYPAPIYSMCWNGAITLILARLWLLAAPLHIIAGLYFILAGIGRFVEETRRNGPRPRPHRWISIASVLAGASITALARSAPAPAPHLAWTTLLPAVLLGAAVAIAARADFPKPNRRFARIPGVTAGDIFISE
jgi:membrane-associated phospholipid phosphatase